MSATSASRVRVNTLNSVDLPTLGRPTRATTGSIEASLHAPGADAALHVLDVREVADDERRRLDRLATQSLARDELAFGQAEPMHIALAIADHHLVAVDRGRAQPAVLERVLLPQVGTAGAIERPDVAFGVDRDHHFATDGDAGIGGKLALPQRAAGVGRERDQLAAIAGRVQRRAVGCDVAVHVRQTFDFGAAFGRRDRLHPELGAVVQAHRDDAAVVESAVDHAVEDQRRRIAAQAVRRHRLFEHPAARPIRRIEPDQAARIGAHDDDAVGDRRARDDLRTQVDMPAFGAIGGAESVHLAVESTRDQQVAFDGRAAGPAQRTVAAPPEHALALTEAVAPERTPGRRVDRLDGAVERGRVQATIRMRRRQQGARVARAVAHAFAPDPVDLRARRELRQWRWRLDVVLLAEALDPVAATERNRECHEGEEQDYVFHEPFFSASGAADGAGTGAVVAPPTSSSFICSSARAGACGSSVARAPS